MKSQTKLGSVRTGGMYLFLVCILFACNNRDQNSPFSTSQSESYELEKPSTKETGKGKGGGQTDVGTIGLLKQCQEVYRTETKKIDSSGGFIWNSGHWIYIPQGALDKQTKISFTVEATPELVLEFGPHGLEFNKPVKIGFNYRLLCEDDLKPSDFSMVFLNPETGAWDPIKSSVDSEKGEVIGEILQFFYDSYQTNHFSRYALSRR